MDFFHPSVALIAAFFCGSIPTALILGKMKGIDLRTVGSGNIGATNAFRILGTGLGTLCLLVDIGKAWGPAVAFASAPWLPEGMNRQTWMMVVGMAAIAGHAFSPWLRFKGGKGVASSLGTFLAVAPLAVLICFVVGAIIIGATGYVSLASIIGSVLLPVLIFFLSPAGDRPWAVLIMSALLCAFVIWKHRANISRLMAGTENKIFRSKSKTDKA